MMLFYRISLIAMILIWIASFILWLMPEQMRWDMDLFHIYRLTFLELPAFSVGLGIILVYAKRFCTDSRLFKAVMFTTWGYVLFPVILSGLLIVVTALGITGY